MARQQGTEAFSVFKPVRHWGTRIYLEVNETLKGMA
jgi:hypothetical protein